MESTDKLAGPDCGPTGPSTENEEEILRELYGDPDEDGFYRAEASE